MCSQNEVSQSEHNYWNGVVENLESKKLLFNVVKHGKTEVFIKRGWKRKQSLKKGGFWTQRQGQDMVSSSTANIAMCLLHTVCRKMTAC